MSIKHYYFDYASTTPLDHIVRDKMISYLKESNDEKIEYLSPILQADYIASHLFYDVLNKKMADQKQGESNAVTTFGSLNNQWQMKGSLKLLKRVEHVSDHLQIAFNLDEGSFSEILDPVNGDLSFFVVTLLEIDHVFQ